MRRFLLFLLLTGALSYAGGVWYSLVSDNFHDFFTEYIPFGEEAVLYFEEREFRRRFPNVKHQNRSSPGRLEGGKQVTIPGKSGLSWRVADDENPKGSDLQQKGRHMSALDSNPSEAKQHPEEATPKEKSTAVEQIKKPAEEVTEKASQAKEAVKEAVKPKESEPTPSLSDERRPLFQAQTLIDPLKIPNADEPVVQDLVKILNDIITVINADNADARFTGSMTKAKEELAQVGGKIIEIKKSEQAASEKKVKELEGTFENSAKELMRRVEEMRMQEAVQYQEEFEAEREKIAKSFQDKLKSEIDREHEVSEQRLKNELMEQAIQLKRQFFEDVKTRVEAERNGRLSKLSELSTNVGDLEKLTTSWSDVIDANLKTQHLQVAVDAVRTSLETADRPRPFVRELAALKEIANQDPVVNAAIASINPSAYQKGIPTSAQLVDRFRRVASQVRKASLLPEDAGIASHAASYVLSRVMFQKKGLAVGDDVESILTRTETLLEEGNFDEAAREMNGLQGWAKTLSKDWLGDVRRVLEVQQALDVSASSFKTSSRKMRMLINY